MDQGYVTVCDNCGKNPCGCCPECGDNPCFPDCSHVHGVDTSDHVKKYVTKSSVRKTMDHHTRTQFVKVFTEESMGIKVPSHPRPMTREEVKFVVLMNLEELKELLLTVAKDDEEDIGNSLIKLAHQAKSPEKKNFKNADGTPNTTKIIAEQVNAFIDIDYYNLNVAVKAGMDPDKIFTHVHAANMAKMIKPEGWQEPDIESVVKEWEEKGTWGDGEKWIDLAKPAKE